VSESARSDRLGVVILAAGEGTRMKSAHPKVLHGFAGRSMLGHVLAATAGLDASHTAVVVGHGRDEVSAHLGQIAPGAIAVVQEQQLGTAHAVQVGLSVLPDDLDTVLVLPGDTPLLTASTLLELLIRHRESGAASTLLTSRLSDPTGYGRVLRDDDGTVTAIVEHKDASAAQLVVDEVSALVYAFDATQLAAQLGRVGNANAQGEYYLPDVIALLRASGQSVHALIASGEATAGVNDRVQLAVAARSYRDRIVAAHQRAGVTFVDPATAWVDATVTLGRDVTIAPDVGLHGATDIADEARIGPSSTLTDTVVGARSSLHRTVAVQARVGADVTVGPFAYLRPGTQLADHVHVGTYVELKNSDVGIGSKIPHLSYVGDASIGTGTNIGAATVFVNYDGVAKHRSVIGDHARTGADNMFVAPVRVGDGAYTAAGSIITEDVPPGALAIARGNQRNVEGWVKRRRSGTPAAEAAERADADPRSPDQAETTS
jgi:bifunctional UDP-N-acetylglucosamine pyrophosphorylase/glucosamine-1-phosphate N-acetyltransferase